MKILYISPENTVGTLSTWKRFHESQNNQCEFITFYESPNNFDSGICLNLPFISTGTIYKIYGCGYMMASTADADDFEDPDIIIPLESVVVLTN